MNCKDQDIGKLIGGYELGLLTDEEKQQFENHLLECDYCFQSLYEMAPIANLIREEKLAPSQKVKIHDVEEKVPIKFHQKRWAFAAAIVLVVMISAFIFVKLRSPEEKPVQLRGHDDVSILVLSPVGEVTTLTELRWKPIARVNSYDVKIFTEVGDLLWEGSTADTRIVIPDSINETLIRGQAYFWQVEAQTAKGDRLKSQMIQFKIRN